jgi:hypothetical protein
MQDEYKIANKSFEYLTKFKYLGMTVKVKVELSLCFN